VFTKNRDRLIEGDIARKFIAAVLSQGSVKALLSDDHFSIDGTLIEAWASMKSFRPKDDSGERDFHGEKRSNPFFGRRTDFSPCFGRVAGESQLAACEGHLASLRRARCVSGPWLGFSPRARRRVRRCPCR
jgi:hypothetical protein